MRDEIEKKILELVCQRTGSDDIDMEMDIMEDVGFSSLEAMELITELEEAFRIRIPAIALRRVMTLSDLADVVEEKLKK